jgi:hypothetical protein
MLPDLFHFEEGEQLAGKRFCAYEAILLICNPLLVAASDCSAC